MLIENMGRLKGYAGPSATRTLFLCGGHETKRDGKATASCTQKLKSLLLENSGNKRLAHL